MNASHHRKAAAALTLFLIILAADALKTTQLELESSASSLKSSDDTSSSSKGGGVRHEYRTFWKARGGAQPHSASSSHILANAVGDPEDDSSGADSEDSDDISSPTDSDFFYEDMYDDEQQVGKIVVGVEKGGSSDGDDSDDDNGEAVVTRSNVMTNGDISLQDSGEESIVGSDIDDSSGGRYLDGNVQSLLIREVLSDYIYLPPSFGVRDTWAKKSNAMRVDVESKKNLDRRGLYRALLLEMAGSSAFSDIDSNDEDDEILRGPVNGRRYLDQAILYKLKSAISLASQPSWRQHKKSMKSSTQSSGGQGLSFSDAGREMAPKLDPDEESRNSHLATQSMQEIVAMALAHSYNCGFVILDDNILSTIRNNVDDDQIRNADVLRELFSFSNRDNALIPNSNPLKKIDEEADILQAESIARPIVVFLRSDGCGNLLKSKTCVDILQQACLSDDSRNLLVLGREPPFFFPNDSKHTSSSPAMGRPPTVNQPQITNFPQPDVSSPDIPVGKNDPEGSRRFNIFLVRLSNNEEDAASVAKIMGILAPAEAGNLFPQIVSNVTPENLDSLTKTALSNNTALTSATIEVHLGDQDTAAKEASLSQGMQTVMDQLISKILAGDGSNNNIAAYVKDVLSNQLLRRGMADNLSRAAPAFLDPRCSGVMLSVYIPPIGQAKQLPSEASQISNSSDSVQSEQKKNWLNKILSSHRDEILQPPTSNQGMSPRVNQSQPSTPQRNSLSKNFRNLQLLQAQCSYLALSGPRDPVRMKSWTSWIQREHCSIFRRRNKRALSSSLRSHKLKLSSMDEHLSQLLSSKDFTNVMNSIVESAVEIEADKYLMSQLFFNEDKGDVKESASILLVHSESIIKAIKHLYPQTATTSSPNHHLSKDDLTNMAADKHERALVNNIIFPEQIGISYEQIGGLGAVKDLLRQSITYPLRYPHLYSEGIARESVKGVLLYGPPGTGKTLLAKAVATEGGATFLSVDPSSVENKWLGESEKNAKAVFTLARRLAPCVIFLDEVDSLLSSREHSDDSAHGTLTSVKTTMMSEWDGLNTNVAGNDDENHRVVVIGSTNRPFDLDEAVLRRFPRRILVDLPDLNTRKEILEVTLSENRLNPQVNLTAIAERLEGYTGSDIKEVCREAVVQISHEKARMLDQGDIIGGEVDTILRPVNMTDFDEALSKLKRSVSERGRELARVYEWNEQYGEIKKKENRGPQLMNMFL